MKTRYVKARPHDHQSETTLGRSTRGVRWVDIGHSRKSWKSGLQGRMATPSSQPEPRREPGNPTEEEAGETSMSNQRAGHLYIQTNEARSKLKETSMATASDTGNPPRPLAPRLGVGDEIPVFSLPNTSGVSVSSTALLEPGPLIITFYRGIWCPYCRSDLMALMNAMFEVQSRGGSLAAIARETAPNSN